MILKDIVNQSIDFLEESKENFIKPNNYFAPAVSPRSRPISPNGIRKKFNFFENEPSSKS
jgi:hypothetical protein